MPEKRIGVVQGYDDDGLVIVKWLNPDQTTTIEHLSEDALELELAQ